MTIVEALQASEKVRHPDWFASQGRCYITPDTLGHLRLVHPDIGMEMPYKPHVRDLTSDQWETVQ